MFFDLVEAVVDSRTIGDRPNKGGIGVFERLHPQGWSGSNVYTRRSQYIRTVSSFLPATSWRLEVDSDIREFTFIVLHGALDAVGGMAQQIREWENHGQCLAVNKNLYAR